MTLWEGACGHTGPWGILISNRYTGATALFTAPDVSDAPGRYQLFYLQSVGPTGADPANGRFYVRDSGEWKYSAHPIPYGTVVPTEADLGPAAETGTLMLRPTDPPIPTFVTEPRNIPTFDE